MGVVFDSFEVRLNAEDVVKALGLASEHLEEIAPIVARTKEFARPCAMVRSLPIDSCNKGGFVLGGMQFESNIVSQQLIDCQRVLIYMVSCGTDLQALSDAMTDPVERFWQEAINELVLHQVSEQFHTSLQIEMGQTLYSINPGSVRDWPLTELRKLFELLGDVRARTGVRLSDSCLMLPLKTVCGIYFHSDKEYSNCKLCPRDHCPRRFAPYDPEMAMEMAAGAHAPEA